jgi:hypothetical protein
LECLQDFCYTKYIVHIATSRSQSNIDIISNNNQ